MHDLLSETYLQGWGWFVLTRRVDDPLKKTRSMGHARQTIGACACSVLLEKLIDRDAAAALRQDRAANLVRGKAEHVYEEDPSVGCSIGSGVCLAPPKSSASSRSC